MKQEIREIIKKIKMNKKLRKLLQPDDVGYITCMNHAEKILEEKIPKNDEL